MNKQIRNGLSKVLFIGIALAFCCFSDKLIAAMPENDISHMPVQEVTIFKDGHAYVLHEGKMPTNDQGNVILDYLPKPIIGTFWPFSSQPQAKLTSVVAGKTNFEVHRNASTIAELIKANPGSKVLIRDVNNQSYEATILSVPNPTATQTGHAGQNSIVMLQTSSGVKVIPLNRINELTFIDTYNSDILQENTRAVMTLKLDWAQQQIQKNARVGMVYVQRGIRWIPSYRFELDGEGKALVKLQATLVNELTDLHDVKAHLVVGVPTFAFKDTPDPISLQQTFAQLSNAFPSLNQTTRAFSNAIMSQAKSRMSEYSGNHGMNTGLPELSPEMTGSQKNEDLFIFTVDHITLKKGECMVIPVTEFTLEYTDVFTLDLPFAPPREVRQNFNNRQQAELAQLFNAPKVMHKIRFTNNSDFPITTAPALIFCKDRIVAQGMTKYTAKGASCDLKLTNAVDLKIESKDEVTDTHPNAETWRGDTYNRINLSGNVNITNYSQKPVTLEVKRSLFGKIDESDHDGTITHLGPNENTWSTDWHPCWWGWYNWPWWWYHFNQYGQIKWTVDIQPNQTTDLNYQWHYYWR